MAEAQVGDVVVVRGDSNCFATPASWSYFDEKLNRFADLPAWFRGIVPSHATGTVIEKFRHEKRADRKMVFVVILRDGSLIAVDADGVEVHLSRGSEVQLLPRMRPSARPKLRDEMQRAFSTCELVPIEKCFRCSGSIEEIRQLEGCSFAYLVRLDGTQLYAVAHSSELVRRSMRVKCHRYGEDDVAFVIASCGMQLPYTPLGIGRDQFQSSCLTDESYVRRILSSLQVVRSPYLCKYIQIDDTNYEY